MGRQVTRDWIRRREREFMEVGAGRGLECQKIMGGKNDITNGSDKAAIPSCCLKSLASKAELEAKCHSTVVSGWFCEPWSSTGHCYIFFTFFIYVFIFFCFCFSLYF